MFALVGLYFSGQSINTVTLGGLALVLGLIVDNSIVVLETTDRHIKMGKSSTRAAMDAPLEVAMPVLVSTETKSTTDKGFFGMFNRFINWLIQRYRRTLNWVFGHRWQILKCTLMIFVVSLFYAGKIGYELFPSMDVGQLVVYSRMEPGTPLEESEKWCRRWKPL